MTDDAARNDAANNTTNAVADAATSAPATTTTKYNTHRITAARTKRKRNTSGTINTIDISDSTHGGLQCGRFHYQHQRHRSAGAASTNSSTSAPAVRYDDPACTDAVSNNTSTDADIDISDTAIKQPIAPQTPPLLHRPPNS